MTKIKQALALLLFSIILLTSSRAAAQKIKLTGKVVEKTSQQALEYATVTLFTPGNAKPVTGVITNSKGEFELDAAPGNYQIRIEFISFKAVDLQKHLTANTNLGTIELSEDVNKIDEVVVRAEKTTVEIKLDKKVYNVGNDLMVKGGTVSDVLDNIPSVQVDAEGTVSLRGNENVRILIDGRPSGAINIAEALRLIPADAIDKVEVITNPSARYDSEGGGGLLNIILKKGKNQGINGTIIASAGDPETYGLSANINYKTEEFNFFTTTGYNYRTNPGRAIINTEYLTDAGETDYFINERRRNERLSKGYNSNFGIDWYLTKSTTWTNQFRFRKNSGENPEQVYFDSYDAAYVYQGTTSRFNDQINDSREVEYSTNFVKKFKKDGHELQIDGSFSEDRDNDNSMINYGFETTSNNQRRSDNEVEVDYILPLGKDSRFEAGYSGDFTKQYTDFKVNRTNSETNVFGPDARYTNILDYRENINALYTQYGTKFNKFSVLLGLRWEDSNIVINQLTSQEFNNMRYSNFFPSAFFTYELTKESSISLSYSRRISRPRGRQINPFSNYSSNINIFRGNPNLNPSFTDAFDLGFLKRWSKLTLSTSVYLNKSTDSFQFIRTESGDFATVSIVGGTDITNEQGVVTQIVDGADVIAPVLLTTPINLATEYRMGFEFTLNYSPYKWWRLNSNFNFFRNETQGDYNYVNYLGAEVNQNFDNTAFSWFTRLTSKVTLPYKIEWQTNVTYNAPQKNAQGRSLGIASANLAFSKDLFKEKVTLSLNVQDVFNSRKRIYETFLERQNSYSEMQWRVRSVNLSFTYRFNKKKERDRQQRDNENGGSEEFQG